VPGKRFNSAQAHALRMLRRATLRQTPHGWLVDGEQESALLPDVIVRWLFGEGLLRKGAQQASYTLSDRGRQAADEFHEEARMSEVAAPSGPVLIVPPGESSEELDYLLVVPVATEWREAHAVRLRHAAQLAGARLGEFEFIQFRDEVFALQISPRVAQLGLLPELEQFRLLANGLDGVPQGTALALRGCPDRGVNYGRGRLQWFGGFDEESPLISSPRVDAGALTSELRQLLP